METAILILAAGSSSRMQTAKQMLPVADNTLLGISIESALKSKADEVFCVLGANFTLINARIKHYEVKIIENINFQNGMGSSIAEGLNVINNQNFNSVLIMLGDQPKVGLDYLNHLIELSKKDPETIFASRYKSKFGVPAIFPETYFDVLMNLEGDKGAVQFLNDPDTKVKSTDFNVNLEDIDTQEDYKNLIK